MAKGTYRMTAAMALTANATHYPRQGTVASDRPQELPTVSISLHGNNANDVGMVFDLVQFDVAGTGGVATGATYDDSRVTATPPVGRESLTGAPTTNPKVLWGPHHLHPSDKAFNLELRDWRNRPIVVPAGKIWAWRVINPTGNSAPNVLITQDFED